MSKAELTRDAIHTGYLILINAECPLYEQSSKRLTSINESLLEFRAGTVLKKLLDTDNFWKHITTVSGYRTMEEQTGIYDDSLAVNGKDFTAKYVALPGHSEHQSGLAVDLGLKSHEIDFIRPSFPYTGVCGSFRKKAAEYGFVERYKQGKEHVTGIAHEPWHFRYLGAPHARIMEDKSFVLEEYLDWLKEFPYGKKTFRYNSGGSVTDIFYMKAEDGTTSLDLPDGLPYSISGNNTDGFIVTVWRDRV